MDDYSDDIVGRMQRKLAELEDRLLESESYASWTPTVGVGAVGVIVGDPAYIPEAKIETVPELEEIIKNFEEALQYAGKHGAKDVSVPIEYIQQLLPFLRDYDAAICSKQAEPDYTARNNKVMAEAQAGCPNGQEPVFKFMLGKLYFEGYAEAG